MTRVTVMFNRCQYILKSVNKNIAIQLNFLLIYSTLSQVVGVI